MKILFIGKMSKRSEMVRDAIKEAHPDTEFVYDEECKNSRGVEVTGCYADECSSVNHKLWPHLTKSDRIFGNPSKGGGR